MIKKFEVGQTYKTRFTNDSNFTLTFTVIKRTKKFITIVDDSTGEIKRVGVIILEGKEWAYPMGKYSMAPMINAERK